MNLKETQNEIVESISSLIENYETENEFNHHIVHRELGSIIVLAKRALNSRTFHSVDAKFQSDLYPLLNEAYNKLNYLSKNLYPTTLRYFGLTKALESYSNEVLEKAIKLYFNDETGFEDKVPFTYIEQLNIYRIHTNIIKCFLISSQFKELKITLKKENKETFSIEFISDKSNTAKSKYSDYNNPTFIMKLNSIKAVLLVLNGRLNENSDWINFVKIEIPFKK